LLISIFHDAFADHDDDREKHEDKYLTPVNNEAFIQEYALPISAIYLESCGRLQNLWYQTVKIL